MSIVSSTNQNPAYCVNGGCPTPTCGTGDRMFFASFYMYRENNLTQNQWRSWTSGQHYDLTFNFNSITDDADTNYEQLFVTATLVYENTIFYRDY